MKMPKTTVVVVDDSALIRALLTEIINAQSDMEVIGSAADPLQAREVIRTLNPDVITLDVEMPRMHGLDFLEKIMRLRPMPVIMISTLTEKGAEVTLKALELGAIDYVAKPKVSVSRGMHELAQEICEKIRIAAHAKIFRRTPISAPIHTEDKIKSSANINFSRHSTEKMIVIGASTGGTEAIKEILMQLPADSPAIVITQHMPQGFTSGFARRLDGLCKVKVKEADHGERILPGHAYIAPGGRHLSVHRNGVNYLAEVSDGEPVNRHKPSVEVLFLSVAKNVGAAALGVMLTGMGKDGANAMLEMRKEGAYNFAQDEASCVVFGMPREAIAVGAIDEVLPLTQIAQAIMHRIKSAGSVLSRV